MRILFMGTPDFAVASLRALTDAGYEICACVTQADKPRGRGYTLTPPPVKVFAQEHGIPVLQPRTLRGDEFAALLDGLAPDLIAVAAFGKILPQNVLDYPRHGCVCVHGSLLPEYRGAAPMQRAIIDGKTVTGITTMMMDAGIDTGDILLRAEVAINPDDDFEIIHDRMAQTGARLLIETLRGIEAGTLRRIPQSTCDTVPTYAPKIENCDCIIDFTRGANTIHNQIRALSSMPLAYTRTPDRKLLKVLRSGIPAAGTPAAGTPAEPGCIVSLERGITVACGEDGSERITFTRVLPEGKSRMDAADYIRGRRIAVGDKLIKE